MKSMVRRPAPAQDVTRPVLPGVADRASPPAPPSPRAVRGRRRSLRWRLAVSYVLVTAVAVLALEGLALLAVAQGVLYSSRRVHLLVAENLAPVAASILAADAPPEALRAYLERPLSIEDRAPTALTLPRDPRGYTVVTDATGRPWFDNRTSPDAATAEPALPAAERRLVRRVLTAEGSLALRGLVRTATATPLVDEDGATVGALLQASTLLPAAPGLLVLAGAGLLVGSAAVVGIGTAFGMIASRPLVRRIAALGEAADAWSRGDFARSVADPHEDELGGLARRLDRMARHLGELVRTRDELARARERARLARDLHDTVKQELFGASLLLGAARQGDAYDPDAVDGAAASIERAKRDLAGLIEELGPLAGRSLNDALRELVASRPSGATPVVRLEGDPLPEPSQEVAEAVERIAGEALSNALRHAGASRVVVRTHDDGDAIRLVVVDDGSGFDPDRIVARGRGLASMLARAAAAGGRLELDARPGGGTCVTVTVPMRGPERGAT
jgi:NarL family two-component system sensor histidine kinase LiaS